MRIPPLKIKIVLESNPLKSTILVGGLGVAILQHALLPGNLTPQTQGVHQRLGQKSARS